MSDQYYLKHYRINRSTSSSSVYFSAPCSIASSTDNISFIRKILFLPSSVYSIEFFNIDPYFLYLSIFTKYSLKSSIKFVSKPAENNCLMSFSLPFVESYSNLN